MSPQQTQLAPIALFVYHRPLHTQKTLQALAANRLAAESELIIFSDGPKTAQDAQVVDALRSLCAQAQGFKSVQVICAEKNLGLANSIINGVTFIMEKYGRAIILEDDLVTSPFFLTYMNEGLNLYENELRVASIHGYVEPVTESMPSSFFLRGADCWGWATWKRAWDLFNADGQMLLKELQQQKLLKAFDRDGSYPYTQMLRKQISGQNNSWAIRWHASAFLKNMLTLYPGQSLVENIGLDGSGTHCGTSLINMNSPDLQGHIQLEKISVMENSVARKILRDYAKKTYGIWHRISLHLPSILRFLHLKQR